MLIYVDAPSGRTTGVSITPSDTVADLKVRIEDEEWIPRDRQYLTFHNDKLEDGHTFESYGIAEGATIQLSQPYYAESDEVYCIYVLRTEVEGGEEVLPFWIKANDTIGSLKTHLMNFFAFHGPWRGQHLTFNQQQLEDGYTFSDYNIQESTVIRFHCQTVFPISVRVIGRLGMRCNCGLGQIRVEVTGSETISNFKARLWDAGLIPRSEKHLIFYGMLLDNRRTLSDYNIQKNAEISLPDGGVYFLIQIRFPTGETIRVRIGDNDTIGVLKSRLQAETYIPREMQRLIFGGQELQDKNLVVDYNILKESTVDLQLPALHMHTPLSFWTAGPPGSITIFIKHLTGTYSPIRVYGTDTIGAVKFRIEDLKGTPHSEHFKTDLQALIFSGKELADGKTISNYGIENEATLILLLRLRGGGGCGFDHKNLDDAIAQAISLWDWDGIMPRPGNNTIGLRLSKGDVVTIRRIVNDEWYQGFNNKNISGYFPRAFVRVRKLERPEFKDDIHVDETPMEELQVDRKASNHQLTQRLLRITSKLFPSTPPPPDPDRPDLPPSPKPPPPFDRIVDGNRVLVQFSLDPRDNQRNYTLRATLSLNSAPGARFSGLTLNLDMIDGTILAISPENLVGPETEAEVTKDKNREVSLSTSLHAGSQPFSASIGASTSFARAEHITYIRKTRGTVQGNGVGSSRAYWVMKEDNGPAAEQGLGPVFDLMVKLNVRPAIISFEVAAYILCENGKCKTIESGILGTSV